MVEIYFVISLARPLLFNLQLLACGHLHSVGQSEVCRQMNIIPTFDLNNFLII